MSKHNARKYINPGPAPKVFVDGGDGYYYPDADAERLMDVCARLERVAGALERIADALERTAAATTQPTLRRPSRR